MASRKRFNQARAPQPERFQPAPLKPSSIVAPMPASAAKRGAPAGSLPPLPPPTNPRPAPMPNVRLPYQPAPMPTPQGPSEPRPPYEGERGGAGMNFDELFDIYQKLPPRTRQEFLQEHPAFNYNYQQGKRPTPTTPYTAPPTTDHRGGRGGEVPYHPFNPGPPNLDPTPAPPPTQVPQVPGGQLPPPTTPGAPMPTPPSPYTGGNSVDWFNQRVQEGGSVEGAVQSVIPGAQFGEAPPGSTVIGHLADGTPVWLPPGGYDSLNSFQKAQTGQLFAGGTLTGNLNPDNGAFGQWSGNSPAATGTFDRFGAGFNNAQDAPPEWWTDNGPVSTPPQPSMTQAPMTQAPMAQTTQAPSMAQAPMAQQMATQTAPPGGSVFPNGEWAPGLPLSPQFEAARRALEDQLAGTLSAIGVQESQIPITLALMQARLKSDEEEAQRQIGEAANARGVYSSGGTRRDLGRSAQGFERTRRDAANDAASALTDLALARQGAHSDYARGLAELILQLAQDSEGDRTNDDPGKKDNPKPSTPGPRKRRNRRRTPRASSPGNRKRSR